jgi:transposase-like protein
MRWTPKRKAELLVAIKEGAVSPEIAQRKAGLSQEELSAWMRDFDEHGQPGLMATNIQLYARHRRWQTQRIYEDPHYGGNDVKN